MINSIVVVDIVAANDLKRALERAETCG